MECKRSEVQILSPRLRIIRRQFNCGASPRDCRLICYVILAHNDKLSCNPFCLRLSLYMGVVRSRWASWSSKPVAGRVAGRGGFDAHPLSPIVWMECRVGATLHKFYYR